MVALPGFPARTRTPPPTRPPTILTLLELRNTIVELPQIHKNRSQADLELCRLGNDEIEAPGHRLIQLACGGSESRAEE